MTRETLLLIALQSGALFLALWGIFRLIPSIPANAKAWMWRLAFLKPLLSLLPFAVVTLPLLPRADVVPSPPSLTETVGVFEATPVSGIRSVATADSPTFVGEAIPFAAEKSGLPIDPFLAAWYLGVALVAVFGLRGMYVSQKAVRQAENIERADLQLALGELLNKAQVNKPTRLLSSDRIQSAMLVGGRSYNILLPQEAVENGSFQDLRLMLAHEVAHIARRDLVWFGLTSAVQSLFFFNPMVWIAARCSRLDHESATDRHASQLAGVPVQTYAEMLLRATVVSRPSLVPGSLPMAESYRTIHRRLEAMKHFNTKPTFWRRTATAALAMLTLSLLPAYELRAAAYPDEFYPEDLALSPQAATAEPFVQVTQAKPVQTPKTVKASQPTVAVKAVVGKDKKVRYYVKTKKGYVEVSAADVKNQTFTSGQVFIAKPAIATSNGRNFKAVAAPVIAQPVQKATTKVSKVVPITTGKVINLTDAPGVQVATGSLSKDPVTVGTLTTGQTVSLDGVKGTLATTTGQQSLTGRTVTSPATIATGNLATTKPLTATNSLGATVNYQGTATIGSSVNVTKVQDPSLPQRAYVTSTQATTNLSTSYGTLLQSQNKATGSKPATIRQKDGKVTTNYWVAPSTANGQFTWTYPGNKVQIINTGDGKVKVINANGKTKVYELKKGAIYEFDGQSFREIKAETGKSKAVTFKSSSNYYIKSDGVVYRYQGTAYEKSGNWYIFRDGKDGVQKYYIVGPDGKLQKSEKKPETKKVDPTKRSEIDESPLGDTGI